MRNLNLTSQRQAVYDIVRNSHDHPTAAEVMNRLVEQGHNLAYGTVYNSLRYLTDKEMIRELKLGRLRADMTRGWTTTSISCARSAERWMK